MLKCARLGIHGDDNIYSFLVTSTSFSVRLDQAENFSIYEGVKSTINRYHSNNILLLLGITGSTVICSFILLSYHLFFFPVLGNM